MHRVEVIYNEPDACPGRPRLSRWIEVDHQELAPLIPVSPGCVSVFSVVALVSLDVSEGESDQIAIEMQRAIDVRDAQLDLDQARGHWLTPEPLREHPTMTFEVLDPVLALPLVRLRLAPDRRAAAPRSPEMRVAAVPLHAEAGPDERSVEPLPRAR